MVPYLPSPKDPSLYSLSNLDLQLEVFPHLVLVLLGESRRIARITLAGTEDLLVRGGAPFAFPASADTASIEPLRAVCQSVGPFADDRPDVGTFELDERLALIACVADMLVEGAGELQVTEDLVHVL